MTYKTVEAIFDVSADTLAAVKAEPLRQELPKVNAGAVVENFCRLAERGGALDTKQTLAKLRVEASVNALAYTVEEKKAQKLNRRLVKLITKVLAHNLVYTLAHKKLNTLRQHCNTGRN